MPGHIPPSSSSKSRHRPSSGIITFDACAVFYLKILPLRYEAEAYTPFYPRRSTNSRLRS